MKTASVALATMVLAAASAAAYAQPLSKATLLGQLDADQDGKITRQETAAARERIAARIHATAQVSIAHVSVAEIDAINILQASLLAMRRAIAGLGEADFALIDGNRPPPDLPCRAEAVVKGDATSLSIAAASIVAKVARDAIMVDLAQLYPPYGWNQNAGYPTPRHLQALLDFGVTPWYRRSFRPVHNILYQDI